MGGAESLSLSPRRGGHWDKDCGPASDPGTFPPRPAEPPSWKLSPASLWNLSYYFLMNFSCQSPAAVTLHMKTEAERGSLVPGMGK